MENERVAEFFIGTLLEQQIESVEVKPQEMTYTNELAGVAVFRLDFIATIRTESGEMKKVLIEIKKAKNQIDLIRFRNYLGEQYKKEDRINNKKTVLPITTIYILGFRLPEIETACIKVERNYKDLINKTIIEKKSDFIEGLTHDCFVVQVDRITDRYTTRLDKLLSLFEQANFIDDRKTVKDFLHEIDNDDVKVSTDILHYAGTDPKERERLAIEQEAWRSIDAMFEDKENMYLQKMEEGRIALEESKKALEEKEKLIEDLRRRLGEK